MSSIGEVFRNLDWSVLLRILLQAIPALICIMVHEISHGLVAYALGDRTAKEQGRLSLNPLHHIDWIGMIMLLVFHFGWAKPVQVDIRHFRHPKRDMALTALAGPASNFLLAILFLFLYGLLLRPLSGSTVGKTLLELLKLTAYISIGFCIFNLIPVPPLDGSKILFSLLPDAAYWKLMRYERYGSIALILLVWSGVLGRPLSRLIRGAYGLLFPIAEAAFHLMNG